MLIFLSVLSLIVIWFGLWYDKKAKIKASEVEAAKIQAIEIEKRNKIETFRNTVQSTIAQFLENHELVQMAKNFIDNLPSDFYTSQRFLIYFDLELEVLASDLGQTLYFVSEEQKEFFYADSSFLDRNKFEIDSYFDKRFKFYVFLSQFIKETDVISEEQKTDFGLFVTSLLINKIVPKHFAEKFEQENKQYFEDIETLNLDDAITRYCFIETFTPDNEFSFGCFIYYLIEHKKFGNDNADFLECYQIVMPKLEDCLRYKEYDSFINKLKTPTSQKRYSIDDVDLMGGLDFEKFVAELFTKMGYSAEVTKASGDQGIDVIASKNGSSIGIQAKCYSGSVGNSAIQEVVAGKTHYKLDKALVVTNSFFTESAQQLAQSNSVILWDRNILKQKIDECF
jgi:hypothetical protein